MAENQEKALKSNFASPMLRATDGAILAESKVWDDLQSSLAGKNLQTANTEKQSWSRRKRISLLSDESSRLSISSHTRIMLDCETFNGKLALAKKRTGRSHYSARWKLHNLISDARACKNVLRGAWVVYQSSWLRKLTQPRQSAFKTSFCVILVLFDAESSSRQS